MGGEQFDIGNLKTQFFFVKYACKGLTRVYCYLNFVILFLNLIDYCFVRRNECMRKNVGNR